VPEESGDGRPVVHWPVAESTDAVTVASGLPVVVVPDHRRSVTSPASPVAVPAVPEKVGVVSLVALPFGGELTATAGGVVSIVNVRGALSSLFPAASDCSALAVYVPSASAAGWPAHTPVAGFTGAENAECGLPDASVPTLITTVTAPASPVAVPAVPEKVGVESLVTLPAAGELSTTTGGVMSMVHV